MVIFGGRRIAELEDENAALRKSLAEIKHGAALQLGELEELRRQNEILTRLMGSTAGQAIRKDSVIEVDELGRWRIPKRRADDPDTILSDWQPRPGTVVVRGRVFSDWPADLEQYVRDGEIDAALQIAHECIAASEGAYGKAAPWFVRFAVKWLRAEREYEQALALVERQLGPGRLDGPQSYKRIGEWIRLHASTVREADAWRKLHPGE